MKIKYIKFFIFNVQTDRDTKLTRHFVWISDQENIQEQTGNIRRMEYN